MINVPNDVLDLGLRSKLHVESYFVMIPADELLQHCRTVPTRIALLVGHKLLKVRFI